MFPTPYGEKTQKKDKKKTPQQRAAFFVSSGARHDVRYPKWDT